MGELKKRIRTFERNLVEKGVLNEKEASAIADVFLNLGEEMRREFPNFDDAKGSWAFHVGKVEEWFEYWLN